MDETIATLIVDDEPLAQQSLANLLEPHRDIAIAGIASSVESARRILGERRVDLLFLDIRLPDGNGFEVLQHLEGERPVTVFVTAYDQYALRAFEEEGVDYLIKPFSRVRFQKTLDRVRSYLRLVRQADGVQAVSSNRNPAVLNRLQVRDRGRVFFIDPRTVSYIEAADYYVLLHVSGKSMMLRDSITRLAKKLEPLSFRRVHRSFLMNLERLDYLEKDERGSYRAVLKCGAKIPLGPKYQRAVLNME